MKFSPIHGGLQKMYQKPNQINPSQSNTRRNFPIYKHVQRTPPLGSRLYSNREYTDSPTNTIKEKTYGCRQPCWIFLLILRVLASLSFVENLICFISFFTLFFLLLRSPPNHIHIVVIIITVLIFSSLRGEDDDYDEKKKRINWMKL